LRCYEYYTADTIESRGVTSLPLDYEASDAVGLSDKQSSGHCQ